MEKVRRHKRKKQNGRKTTVRGYQRARPERKLIPHDLDKLFPDKKFFADQFNDQNEEEEYAKDKIKEIDTELQQIGDEWGLLSDKSKSYLVKRGKQIEKFIDKKTKE